LDRLDFPILHQYLLETEALLEGLRKELKSNDENRIMDFIKTEIHVLFEEIKDKEPDLTYTVHRYFDSLDTDYGIVYNQRKKYEDSVAQINETLSGFIEAEDSRMQKIMPHYFEKYKTDGVEYEIYAGQSILRTQKFNRIHLKNLRLWQMITMCEVTRKIDQLRDQLPVPLSTAQLVFVYNHPISVRFRMDDKHFDVDGAYNVRYEIIKKRIDKAYIEGTDERLTQSGKIAIVYTADKDYDEYMEYLTYLRRQQLIEDNIESLTLAKLQGVHGLKALRVTVKL
ncbi:MAG: GAF domain-containing protein, partial [Bacteroidetes bacterium]